MQSKPFYRLGAIALIILVIYSCQKENDLTPTQPNPTTPTTPFQEPNVDVKDVPLDVGFTGPIGLKEIKGSIKGKSLVKDIIKEAFMQLLLNHDLNPMMPPAYRVACSCNPLMECACPNPELIPNSSGMTYPAKLILHYQDATTCQACTPLLSNLKILGDIEIEIDASFGTMGHKISIMPSDEFTVDGFYFDAKLIELHHQFTQPTPLASTYNPSQFPESFYFFSALDSIVVRDTLTNEATIFNSLNTSNSFLTIIDTDNNHGVANNGFGLLDDVYKLDLVDLSVTCSNTVTVIENTTESLIYDFACDCIQDGEVVMEIPGLCSCDYPRYDYGYVDPSTGQSSGECDDLIRCYTQGISFAPTNNTAGTRSPCSPATQEIINCL